MTTKITSDNIDATVGSGADVEKNAFNISLLGFKMAVNEGLTIFNLVDGIVDEFQDESGTDESEGSNDNYCGTGDFYQNAGCGVPYSAGFTTSTVTEPDTSTAMSIPGTNSDPAGPSSFGTFTVPACVSSVTAYVWGAAGAGGAHQGGAPYAPTIGGGGGFTQGNISTSPGQVLYVSAGEGGHQHPVREGGFFGGGNSQEPLDAGAGCSSGGGIAGVFAADYPTFIPKSAPALTPQIYLIAGGGGGGGGHAGAPLPWYTGNTTPGSDWDHGGSGGGLIGSVGSDPANTAQVSSSGKKGGGGSQTQGGEGGNAEAPLDGSFLKGGSRTGGDQNTAAGGGGFYGGGAGDYPCGPDVTGYSARSGGGGSSYYGHPTISCGSTENGDKSNPGGPVPLQPLTPQGTATGEGNITGASGTSNVCGTGNDGYVLLTATAQPTVSTTVVSTAFSANAVPTNSRIVVFEEDVATPTLNTDIVASISRDGGTTYTNATLSDSGYVTGTSGQRILTGQADISGQPSGQSMRWKLALANNKVKIHGVSLQWS